MEDRRIFERINARFPVRFLDPVGAREGSADTSDISANGMCIVTNEELPKKMPLELWLKIPDSHEPFYTRGEVIWSVEGANPGERRVGIRLERAELMGLARMLWMKARQ